MAEKTLSVVLVPRADTEANFTTGNPLLLEGEIAISLDKNGMYKVGDGVNNWVDLAYNAANTANTATNSTNDKNGKDITSYISEISYSGHTLQITNGAGSVVASYTTADTTYSNMGGATSELNGTSGLVPAPVAGDNVKFLNGAGQWDTPVNTTYTTGTSSYSGTTKLYTNTGENTDGTMDQNSITTALAGKAASSHTHGNSDITAVDASKITSGTIDVARLPAGALERLIIVADDTARFALTTATAQLGDTVKVTSTGVMYFIIDDTNLDNENGYEVYAAGTVAWSSITDKPSTYTPATHTHSNTDVTGLDNLLTGTSGYFLISNGSSAPTWSNVIDGGVESAAS